VAFLSGGLGDSLDIATKNIYHMYAYLKYTLVKYPDFWEETQNGMELYDVNIMEAVYNKVLEFEESWISEVWGLDKKKKTKKKNEK